MEVRTEAWTYPGKLMDLFTALLPLVQRGYVVTLVLDKGGPAVVEIQGGDSNCPHKKFFDPEDGHGFTMVDDSDLPLGLGGSFYTADYFIREINKREGKAHDEFVPDDDD